MGLLQSHLWAKVSQKPCLEEADLGGRKAPVNCTSRVVTSAAYTCSAPDTSPVTLWGQRAGKDMGIQSGRKCRSKGQEMLGKNALIRS